METGDALPPEIYRLDAHRLPWAKGRARRRVSALLAVAAAAATLATASGAPTLRAALDAALGVVVVAGVVAPYALWSAGRSVRRSWNAFELAVGPHSLRVAAPGLPRLTVPRAEITSIVERRSGLTVRTAAGGPAARVPADVEAYAEIRARLAKWTPIVRRFDARAALSATLLATACGACALLALASVSPVASVAALMFVTMIGTLALVDVALRPALQPTTRTLLAVVIAAGLVGLLAQALSRAV